MSRLICALPLLLAVMVCLPSSDARACAPVVRPGSTAHIADESALIIWNTLTTTQHFIRRASFVTGDPDLGFLVPTPSKPEIGEASDDVFTRLADITKPQTIDRPRGRGRSATKSFAGPSGMSVREPADVAVLALGRVGHLDYAILKAEETKALLDWLAKNGYDARPELQTWLDDYVRKKWVITAFKFAKKAAGDEGVSTSALRMTFKTPTPFFPYSEPDSQRVLIGPGSSRILRVYFLAEARPQGHIGDARAPWPGNVVWADRIAPLDQEGILDLVKLPHSTAPVGAWLTEFEDVSSPRPPGGDLFFTPSPFAGAMKRPPIYVDVDPPTPPGPQPLRALAVVGGIAGAIVVFLALAALLLWRGDPRPRTA